MPIPLQILENKFVLTNRFELIEKIKRFNDFHLPNHKHKLEKMTQELKEFKENPKDLEEAISLMNYYFVLNVGWLKNNSGQ